MIIDDLFENILIKPSERLNQINILSGYASPAMANLHISHIPNIKINLIVGMAPKDGIGRGAHNGFRSLTQDKTNFECSYLTNRPAVHIKSYIWLQDGIPQLAYTGSGNYGQNAFFGGTVESFAEDDPFACHKVFQHYLGMSSNCLDEDIETKISFYDEVVKKNGLVDLIKPTNINDDTATLTDNCVVLSLLSSRTGVTHSQSGLNWGQRLGREPNQAYIPVPSTIASKHFFPIKARHFTLITDDGYSLDCVIAQQGDKAIETTKNNSILGKYFRHRLGIANGEYVTLEHLLNYGRTDVKVYKIDDETYYMDFSV